jgi:hypothetical protein
MVIPAVQVIYSLEIGGVEKLAVTIAAHMDRRRFQPAICALDGSGVLAEELEKCGIPYHVLWRKGFEAGVLARLYRCFRQPAKTADRCQLGWRRAASLSRRRRSGPFRPDPLA